MKKTFKQNIFIKILNKNKKKLRFWTLILLIIYILFYPNLYNAIFTILFCYMWWNYLIPDILDIVCHYLSIQRKYPIKNNGFFYNLCNNYTNKSKNTLKKYGNIPINYITIYRTPIYNIIDNTLNIITFGKFNHLKQKFGIDTLFHLSLIANVGNDDNIVIEKNEMINITSDFDKKLYKDSQKIIIQNINKNLTINNILENTRKKIKNTKFFSYDAFENNCQIFIKNILKNNQLYNKNINCFLYQDISKFIYHLPYYSRRIINFSTNTFAILCNIIQKI